MLKTGIVIDPRYQLHQTPQGHPERPQRLGALLDLVQKNPLEQVTHLSPRAASEGELALNHDPDYVRRVAATAGQDFVAFDADTCASSHSYEAACLAAGGCLTLLDAIMRKEIDNGFALVRPPGHHAEFAQAMGFCLFNNVAVAAHYLRRHYDLTRILIVNWDVHHGNGTEHSFYHTPHVLYVSLHQWPHYPGTGAATDVGQGPGKGFTVNVPLPAHCAGQDYVAAFQTIVEPVARQFDPQFVLISAGFDAHQRDPLSTMELTAADFSAMANLLLHLAHDHAQGRCALVLEGGYDLVALQQSVLAVLHALGRPQAPPPLAVPSTALRTLQRVNDVQKRYWSL